MQTGGESLPELEAEERTPLETEVVETEQAPLEEKISDDIEEIEGESVRDTTERIFKKLQKEAQGERNQDGIDAQKQTDPEEQKADDKPIEDFDPELEPPSRFSSRAKQLFSNLPKGLKRELNKTVRDLEALGTRERQTEKQQIEQERQSVAAIHSAVAPYLPKWGRPAAQAIAELAAAHEKLTNPETSFREYVKLGQLLGHDVSHYTQQLAQKDPSFIDVTSNPAIRSVIETNNQLLNWKNQIDAQSEQQAVSRIVSEIDTVRQERDPASGRHKWPELYDEVFLQSAKPLISARVRNVPGMSYGEAAIREVLAARGHNASATSTPTNRNSLPAAESTRAPSAALSVRSRSAPAVGTQSTTEPPPEALGTVRSTTEWVYEQLRQGKRI